MNHATPYEQKLISRSKTMLIFFRVFFFLFSAMAILPWIFPTSKLAFVLLTLLPKFSTIHFFHYDMKEFFSSMTFSTRILGLIGSILSLFPLLAGCFIMVRLTKNYIRKEVFSLKNAAAYSQLGLVFLFSALLLGPLSDAFISLAATINNPVGHRTIEISFGTPNLTEILFSIIFIILGHVMKLGHKISEEHELTV